MVFVLRRAWQQAIRLTRPQATIVPACTGMDTPAAAPTPAPAPIAEDRFWTPRRRGGNHSAPASPGRRKPDTMRSRVRVYAARWHGRCPPGGRPARISSLSIGCGSAAKRSTYGPPCPPSACSARRVWLATEVELAHPGRRTIQARRSTTASSSSSSTANGGTSWYRGAVRLPLAPGGGNALGRAPPSTLLSCAVSSACNVICSVPVLKARTRSAPPFASSHTPGLSRACSVRRSLWRQGCASRPTRMDITARRSPTLPTVECFAVPCSSYALITMRLAKPRR